MFAQNGRGRRNDGTSTGRGNKPFTRTNESNNEEIVPCRDRESNSNIKIFGCQIYGHYRR